MLFHYQDYIVRASHMLPFQITAIVTLGASRQDAVYQVAEYSGRSNMQLLQYSGGFSEDGRLETELQEP